MSYRFLKDRPLGAMLVLLFLSSSLLTACGGSAITPRQVLEPSPARLELARSLVELGAAMRRVNHRRQAREPLAHGMELARRCGAAALVQRAHHELRATGARPRKIVLTGVEFLTASELRVCQLAANGLSNPEIAQQLYLTRKTVETHLGHAYRKLGISSRNRLTAALERP